MSHYTVMVICRKGTKDDVESILAPYDENLEVAPYVEETKAELIAKKIKEIGRRRRSHEAALRLSEDEYGAIAEKEDLFRGYGYAKGDDILKGYDSVDLTDETAVFELIKERCGDELNEDGDLISTYNPNSKWDWFEVGGRWSGLLRLKDGSKADSAPAGLIDWDAMFSPNPAAAATQAEFWDEYVLRKIPEGVEDADKYLYDKFGFIFYRPEYYLEFYGTKEEYIRRMGLWSTFAVVDGKGWYEPGEMGWFGTSSDTPESKKDWEDNFRSRFVDTLDPDDVVTIVDCHI